MNNIDAATEIFFLNVLLNNGFDYGMIKYFVLIFKIFCFEFTNHNSESNNIYRVLKDLYIDRYYKKHVDIFRREPRNDEREVFSIAHRIDTVVFILDYYSNEVRFRAKIFPSFINDIIHFKNDKLNFHKEMIYLVRHLGMFDPLIPNIYNLDFFHIVAKGLSDLQDSIPLLSSRNNYFAKLWSDYKMTTKEFKYKEQEDWVELIWSGSKVKVNYNSYLKDLIDANNQQYKIYVYTNFKKIVFPFYDQENLPIKFIKISFEHEYDYIKNNFKTFIEKENYENDRCGECDRLLYFSDVRCNRNGFLAHKSCMNASLGLTENCTEYIKLKNQNLEIKFQEFNQKKDIAKDRNRSTMNFSSIKVQSTREEINIFEKVDDQENQVKIAPIYHEPDIKIPVSQETIKEEDSKEQESHKNYSENKIQEKSKTNSKNISPSKSDKSQKEVNKKLKKTSDKKEIAKNEKIEKKNVQKKKIPEKHNPNINRSIQNQIVPTSAEKIPDIIKPIIALSETNTSDPRITKSEMKETDSKKLFCEEKKERDKEPMESPKEGLNFTKEVKSNDKISGNPVRKTGVIISNHKSQKQKAPELQEANIISQNNYIPLNINSCNPEDKNHDMPLKNNESQAQKVDLHYPKINSISPFPNNFIKKEAHDETKISLGVNDNPTSDTKFEKFSESTTIKKLSPGKLEQLLISQESHSSKIEAKKKNLSNDKKSSFTSNNNSLPINPNNSLQTFTQSKNETKKNSPNQKLPSINFIQSKCPI